jgi:hypothetical protein
VSSSRLTIRADDAKGEALPASALQGLFLFESEGDRNPLTHPKRDIATGCARVEAPQVPFGFSLLTSVEGFGTVRLYADAQGRGYRAGPEVVLNRELAASRLAAVNTAMEPVNRRRATTACRG